MRVRVYCGYTTAVVVVVAIWVYDVIAVAIVLVHLFLSLSHPLTFVLPSAAVSVAQYFRLSVCSYRADVWCATHTHKPRRTYVNTHISVGNSVCIGFV